MLGAGLALASGGLCMQAAGCMHFAPPDGCKLVDGKVSAPGSCILFAAKPK
jgi:hypothetical protein